MRVALGLEYDGRYFEGWQTQPSGQTVQDYLESAVVQFTGEKIKAVCAGRTDAKVHACGQVVHLDTETDRKEVSWIRGLNSYLPSEVAVRWAKVVPEEFHARFSAVSRTYEYWIANEPVRSPLLAGRAGWVFRPLDEVKMHEAGQLLLGEHDFSSFRAVGCQSKTPVKTIEFLNVERRGRMIRVHIKANAFLYHMVRNIVGCLVYVGQGARPVEWMEEVLEARSRQAAAPTFYPSGLYLAGVGYPEKFGLPAEGNSPF
ncbi:tRNA pseudouridine(38-40) synthase TruA [uncultured Parasutterella sp.]|uniref:tRNA pseudouridine(38-40) synthase TruA n=1 Tax=uncultured Parasutterella sp. TaxID=1263098 RepID=UPI002598BFF1|nr:tRNA pseudouridine(38-40) synthase TruA [uncultured Parasutterella sp.]